VRLRVCPHWKQYGDVHIYKTSFRGMKHTLTKREEKTLMKLIVHPETDKVLAVHMCGYVLLSAVHLLGWGACFWVCKPSVQQTKKHAHQEACTPRSMHTKKVCCTPVAQHMCMLLRLLVLLAFLAYLAYLAATSWHSCNRARAAVPPGSLDTAYERTLHTRGPLTHAAYDSTFGTSCIVAHPCQHDSGGK